MTRQYSAKRPSSVCTYKGCPELAISGGRCAKHQREPWQGRRGFDGYKKDWLRIRKQVLTAEPNCRVCGDKATTVDHIVAKAFGGTDALSNLRPLCDRCRKIKDSADAAEGRRRSQQNKQP